MRALLVLVLAVCVRNSSQAALYPISLSEKVAGATVIAEGRVESQHSFWNSTHTFIYTASRVKLSKTFKGTKQLSVIDVLTYGGTVDDYVTAATDLLELQVGDEGIFFAMPNTFGLRDPATGQLLYDIYSSGQGFIKYSAQGLGAGAPFVRYNNVEDELYPELARVTGKSFDVIDPAYMPPARVASRGTGTVISFSPANVRAGALDDATNNLLTINGSGFGATPDGDSRVYFDDANNGTGGTTAIYAAYGDPLIVSWTDAQIKVKVPSRAGTGTFYVTDSSGTTVATSSTPLVVDFAVQTGSVTVSGTTYVKEYNLMNANGLGGYTITYGSSSANSGADFSTSAAKTTFQRALATWKATIGFNIVESDTTTITQTVNALDGLNVVQYDNASTGQGALPAGVLATCYSGGGICGTNIATTGGLQLRGFDITVRSSYTNTSNGTTTGLTTGPCPPSTSVKEYDLETVLLHELGHAIGHGHINNSYEGLYANYLNPAKLMNYAEVNGSKRVSPDWSALKGGQYLIAQDTHTFGTCYFTTEMTPLTATLDAHDECPSTFPATASASFTKVSFDLSKATSNKNTDPQYNYLTSTSPVAASSGVPGTGTGITNTVFYALKTAATSSLLRLTVSNYTTSPAAQASCSSQGVELALYKVSSCPTGQAYSAPVAVRTITGNGALADIAGLSASSNYLLVMDGKNNTFASYTLAFTGSTALPVEIRDFSGEARATANVLSWSLGAATGIQRLQVERSVSGKDFTPVGSFDGASINADGRLEDNGLLPQLAYYRLKITEQSGTVTYSQTVALRRPANTNIYLVQPSGEVMPELVANVAAEQPVALVVADAAGRKIWESRAVLDAGANRIPLNMAPLSSGLYLLTVRNADGLPLFTTRFVHQ